MLVGLSPCIYVVNFIDQLSLGSVSLGSLRHVGFEWMLRQVNMVLGQLTLDTDGPRGRTV